VSLKEKWIDERAEELRTGTVALLVKLAEDQGVSIPDTASIKKLSRRVATAEWEGRAEEAKGRAANFEELDANFATAAGLRDAVERAGLYIKPDKVLVDDIAPDEPDVEYLRSLSEDEKPPHNHGFDEWPGDPCPRCLLEQRIHYREGDKYKGQDLDYPPADVTGIPFVDMESGPMMAAKEEPREAVLARQIMQRWIGAIGGMDWYNGPTDRAETARSHGKALAAALDGVFQDLQRPPRGLREPATSSGWFVYEVLLPEFLEQFLAKNADYGDQHRAGLGVRAEYVGIHRKVEKLKTALWDGQVMNGEGPREMLFDLIGQCFIVLDLMAQEQARAETEKEF